MSSTLILALVAMLLQQSFTTMGKSVVPVIAPAMTLGLGVEPELVGVYVGILGAASTLSAMACGRFIQRWGAMRTSQGSLVLMAAGLGLSCAGWLPLIALGAFATGIATAVATPASSEILARYAPPRQAPLIFSIKQTGVPAGTMLAGLIGTLVAAYWGWRAALLVSMGSAVLLAVALHPLTRRFDEPGGVAKGVARAGTLRTMADILRHRELRGLAFAHGAYVGLQTAFGAFFVTFATIGLDWALTTAGQVFAGAQAVAIGARIFWGWLGGKVGGARRLLGLLGIGMAFAAGAVGAATAEWPFALVVLATVLLSATAVSWHGIMLAEVARLAPPGMVGALTGGVIAFGSFTGTIYPLALSFVIGLTGSYAWCFWLAAIPPFLVGATFFHSRLPLTAPR